jgi:predicted outer membrane protein
MSGTNFDLASSTIVVDEVNPSPLNQQDQAFLQQAQISNLAEIAEGKLALSNTSTDATREFGRWMIGDHGANSTVLTSLAEQLGVTLPTEPDPQHQAELSDLASRKGADFDNAYATLGVTDHAQAIALFQQEIANGANPAVVSFAQQTLPLLQAHYEQATILAGVEFSKATDTLTLAPPPADGNGEFSEQDIAFAKQAATSNLTEIAEGQDAIARSDNVGVDEYGRWMIANHTAANAALITIAGDIVSSASAEAVSSTSDEAYLSHQVLGHTETLMQFITEAETGQNADLVTYAKSALPVLAQHLASAIELQFGVDLPDTISTEDFGTLLSAADSDLKTVTPQFFGQFDDHHNADKLVMACDHTGT